MTLTETPRRPVISSIDEEFAVLLEEHDDTAWKKLLREVSPQFGNPIADQVSEIMMARMDGEEVGGLIRKMLADKATHERIVRELEYDDDTDSEVDEE